MNIIIMDGTDENDNFGEKITSILKNLLSDDFKIKNVTLRNIDIKPCRGCFHCWIQSPGECIIKDSALDITKQLIQADILVYVTPIVFGGYSFHLKKALDRSISLISPFFTKIDGETHHKTRYDNYPNLIVIGISNKVDIKDPLKEVEEKIFRTLVHRNKLNMHIPKYAVTILDNNDTDEQINYQLNIIAQEMEISE